VNKSGFYQQVYEVVARVPVGWVVTYGQIARHLGKPGAARTVGWAMRHCPEGVPWHRVVNSRGEVSQRARDLSTGVQKDLLGEEGVELDTKGRIDLVRYGWDEI